MEIDGRPEIQLFSLRQAFLIFISGEIVQSVFFHFAAENDPDGRIRPVASPDGILPPEYS